MGSSWVGWGIGVLHSRLFIIACLSSFRFYYLTKRYVLVLRGDLINLLMLWKVHVMIYGMFRVKRGWMLIWMAERYMVCFAFYLESDVQRDMEVALTSFVIFISWWCRAIMTSKDAYLYFCCCVSGFGEIWYYAIFGSCSRLNFKFSIL